MQKLRVINEQIHQAELQYQRQPGSVTLLAVSKMRTAEEIAAAAAAGQLLFGESYVQEAIAKMNILRNLPLEWHFIGRVQSNKVKLLAQHFAWVQTVCRQDIAELLNRHRPASLPPLNVCIEVNLSNEASKGGVNLSEVHMLAEKITQLPRLNLRGLMAIPAPESDFTRQVAAFSVLQQEFSRLQSLGFVLDTLSMGMSDDFIAAIAAGSTMVRIGTAIFGPR